MKQEQSFLENGRKVLGRIGIVFLSLSLLLSLFHLNFTTFNPDEFQHMHIAWNMSRGKMIYKDFFEHHGPLYALLNNLVIRLFSVKPEFNSLFLFRYLSFAYGAVMLWLTGSITCRLTKSRAAGLFAAAVFSLLYFFQSKVTEMRPDILQNMLALAAAYLFMLFLEKQRPSRAVLAGVFYGLTLVTNTKALAVIAPVFLFLLIFTLVSRQGLKKLFYSCGLLLLGIGLVLAAVSLYFYRAGALRAFLYWVFKFPFDLLLLGDHPDLPTKYLLFFLSAQCGFVGLSLTGIIFATGTIFRHKRDLRPYRLLLFLLILTLVSSSTLILKLYSQHYLSFLPYLSVLGAYGLLKLMRRYADKSFSGFLARKSLVFKTCLLLLFTSLLAVNLVDAVFYARENYLARQRAVTRFFLENTSREEPVFFTWNDIGGYFFNEDLQYYWMVTVGMEKIFNQRAGYNVYGRNLINRLEENNTRYLISSQEILADVLSDEAYTYIQTHFRIKTELSPVVWERLQP